ncbi:hypothetical protein [Vibrio sp. Of7-15]|uniref:hypothetical protein n=1 Tax=Vibrio sp. Of7-15 TaxID=2724879 RepID=UPI001EF2A785|nr:hypothetical protein [Vibrio sp. Of7-15]
MNDNLHSVDGYWLMVDFPIELREHAARIDTIGYYHGTPGQRKVIEQPAQRHLTWAINQSPLVGKGNSTVARLPEKPTNSTSHTETWGNTGTANQLLTFWLPRQYNHNSLMLLVWYPDDLDDNGNPKANSHPHCFDAQRLPVSGSVAGLTSQGLEAKPTVVETAFGDTWQDIKGSEVYNAILNTIKQNPTLGSALTVGYQQ